MAVDWARAIHRLRVDMDHLLPLIALARHHAHQRMARTASRSGSVRRRCYPQCGRRRKKRRPAALLVDMQPWRDAWMIICEQARVILHVIFPFFRWIFFSFCQGRGGWFHSRMALSCYCPTWLYLFITLVKYVIKKVFLIKLTGVLKNRDSNFFPKNEFPRGTRRLDTQLQTKRFSLQQYPQIQKN